MIKKIGCISILLLCIVLSGCDKSNANENSKLKIAVSILPQKTFVKAVGGDYVDVYAMIPPGNSPENYQPSPKEMIDLNESKVYFSIGVPAEKANIIPKLKDLSSKTHRVDLHEKVSKVYNDYTFESGERDPHIWLSPKRVMVMIETIEETLSKIDPEHTEVYKKNRDAYMKKLKMLDKDLKASIDSLTQKEFLVYHPAFGYFSRDYGIHMIAIEKEGKEASIEDIKKIIDYAKMKDIKSIFYQAQVDSKQAKVIAREIGGKVEKLDPLSPDYIENMESMSRVFKEALN